MGSLSQDFRPLIRAIATTVVPEAERLDASGWTAFENTVDQSMEDRPPALQRRVRLFLRFIQWSALLRHGRFFTSLDTERRARHLERFQDHSNEVLRLGLWGIRTIVFMGYYGQARIADEIGYRPHPRGWSARS